MIYREEEKDLFSVSDDYYFAHCISADFGMGKGIVVEFNKRYDMKHLLQKKYPGYAAQYMDCKPGGDCILEGRVLNLITKERYFHKPTLATMKAALQKMKEICEREGIRKIAMPTIGAGLDRLKWADVSTQIKDVFEATDVEILVCKLKQEKRRKPTMSNVIDVIKKRSSTRGYTPEPLTEDELNILLNAGLQAPTAANRQEIHFTVLKGDNPVLQELEDEKNRLRGLSAQAHNFYYEAPTVIVLSADSTYKWSPLDAGIAVENMALAAEELGLGNLIIGCIYDALRGEKKDYFSKALRFPEHYEYEIAIAFGHRAVSKEPHTYDIQAQVTYL